MPFREKAKNLFRPRSKTNSSTTTTASSNSSYYTLAHTNTHDTLASLHDSLSPSRWPSNVYKPGEAMPRPKYRAVPKPEHTARLAAFQFADAWTGRRMSGVSQYSPMGTRAPSRRNSIEDLTAAAVDGATTANLAQASSSLFSMTDESARTNSLTSFDTSDASGASSSSARSEAGVGAKTAPEARLQESVGVKAS